MSDRWVVQSAVAKRSIVLAHQIVFNIISIIARKTRHMDWLTSEFDW